MNPRLTGFSRHIDLQRLERETRKLLGAGFVFAVLFHCLLVIFVTFRSPATKTSVVRKAERRIITDLIPLPPRIENPYLKWQGPEIMRRRGGPTFYPRMPDMSAGRGFKPLQNFGGGAFPFLGDEHGIDTDALIGAIVSSGRLIPPIPVSEPELFRLDPYQPFIPKRNFWESPDHISMKDDLLLIEDLDTGEYKGLVVLNPANDRDIKGYLYIPATVRGYELSPPASIRRSVAGLADILKKKHIEILTFADTQIDLASPGISKYPFLFIAAEEAFDISDIERRHLAAYLRGGGFAFIEAYGAENTGMPPQAAGSMREMLRSALGAKGELQIIPNDHALYHCYYDFPDGPPRTRREDAVALSGQPAEFLEGLWIGDRLAAVYSEKGYGASWGNLEGAEAFQNMGVNLLVFALSQAGGLAKRLVDDSGR